MMKLEAELCMRRRTGSWSLAHHAWAVVAAASACLWTAADARATEAGVEARLSCRREAGPGRVLCELEMEVSDGRLAWGDALVIRAPDFARPLRSRVGPNAAAGGSPRRLRLPLALAATSAGSGELVVRARLVQCREQAPGSELCEPAVREVVAVVEVGAIERVGR